jgi:hypothetical protein
MKLFVLIAVLSSQAAMARVTLKNTRPVPLPQVETNAWTSADVGRVIPTDLAATSDGGEVALKIGDHALKNLLNSPAIKNSTVGRTATKVQDNLKTEMVVSSGAGKKAVDHKFTFQVLALQAVSRVQYKGWVNAEVNYNARAKESNVELTEKVWDNKEFVISHATSNVQDLSSVGLRWNW